MGGWRSLPIPSAKYFDLFDNNAFYHLIDHLESDRLALISTGSDCLLAQARTLTMPADIRERCLADSHKYPYFDRRVHRVIDLFRSHGGSHYFETLDDAFIGAPDAQAGCAWVYIRDTFALTNLGTMHDDFSWLLSDRLRNPIKDNLRSEQRLVFQLPTLDTYSHRDSYFKDPKQPWHVTMIIPASRFPGIRVGEPQGWVWDDLKYYLRRNNGTVRLNVVGSYFRAGTNVCIVPYVVWA